MSDKMKFILCASLMFALMECPFQRAHAQTNPSISRMYGNVLVTNNYVDRGLTQSNKNPSIGAGFGYGFGGLGRIGFESASVSYPDESTNVEMRLFAEYKFVFTPNADLRVRDDVVRYFTEDQRNKMLVTLDQNFFGYHFLFSREDNFEGTKTSRDWFGFHKDWFWGPSYQVNMTLGYSMLRDFDAYFDGLLGVSYLMSNVTLSLAGTYVSSSSQFNGQADPFVIVGLQARF